MKGGPCTLHFRYCEDPGGANRDRTGDLLLAKQALSQLSYGPWVRTTDPHFLKVGGPVGFGPMVGGSGWIRTIDPRLIKTML